jgi:2-haloacid dehalogenase
MAIVKGIVFDAYGTLFDVHSVIEACKAVTMDPWALSRQWRAKQLEYAWLRALMGQYEDFWAVTEAALRFALRQGRIQVNDEAIRGLMEAYLDLEAFPEVQGTLQILHARFPLGILSNGSPRMLEAAVRSSGLRHFFLHVMSADEVRTYKPSRLVYELAPKHMGIPTRWTLFVSSNAFDVIGAKAFGFQVCWCNRAKAPLDELGFTPDHVVSRLDEVPRLVP